MEGSRKLNRSEWICSFINISAIPELILQEWTDSWVHFLSSDCGIRFMKPRTHFFPSLYFTCVCFWDNLLQPTKKLKDAVTTHSLCVSRNHEKGFALRLYYVKYDELVICRVIGSAASRASKFWLSHWEIFSWEWIQVVIFWNCNDSSLMYRDRLKVWKFC